VLLSTRGKSINLFLVADSPGGLPVHRSFSGRPKNVDRFCPAEIGGECTEEKYASGLDNSGNIEGFFPSAFASAFLF
jgi:hypothetical protein